MIGQLLTEQVTVLARNEGAIDAYNRPAESWAASVTVNGRLELVTPSEGTDEQDVQVGRYRLFVPHDTAISGRDRVKVDGVTYQLLGPPIVHRTPRGAHHIEAVCRAVA